MSKNSDEIVMELAAALGRMEKTAAKKEEKEEKDEKKEKKEEKEVKKDEDKKEKEDKKDEKKDKEDKKKAKAVMSIVHGLAKLAGELDELGADEASSLVDDALKVIVYNVDKE